VRVRRTTVCPFTRTASASALRRSVRREDCARLHGDSRLPATMKRMKEFGIDVDLDDLSFFLGRESLVFTGHSKMTLLRKLFFKFLSNNAVPASAFFRLPPGRVIELGVQIEI